MRLFVDRRGRAFQQHAEGSTRVGSVNKVGSYWVFRDTNTRSSGVRYHTRNAALDALQDWLRPSAS